MNILIVKLLAYLTMLVDHLGYLNYDTSLRILGRLSFPLFCFMLAEGFRHTSNLYKYIARLLAVGLLSEIPYNYAFWGDVHHPEAQNVMFTLVLGLIAVAAADALMRQKRLRFLTPIPILVSAFLSDCLRTDYGGFGVVLIVAFFLLYRQRSLPSAIAVGICMLLFASRMIWLHYPNVSYWGRLQLYALLSLPIILLYNGKKGPTPKNRVGAKLLQYGFYLFYPLHLLILGLIYH